MVKFGVQDKVNILHNNTIRSITEFYAMSCKHHTSSCTDCMSHLYIKFSLFVCLFVRDSGKNYCTERRQTLSDYKVCLRECPPWVEIACLAVLEEISFYFQFSLAAGDHFINYCSLDFRLSNGLICCRSMIDFKLGCRYSYLPLLPAHIRQNWLGPSCCCATCHSRSPPKAGALQVKYDPNA